MASMKCTGFALAVAVMVLCMAAASSQERHQKGHQKKTHHQAAHKQAHHKQTAHKQRAHKQAACHRAAHHQAAHHQTAHQQPAHKQPAHHQEASHQKINHPQTSHQTTPQKKNTQYKAPQHVSLRSYTSGSGSGTTTRYWDGCKTTCAWSANTGSVTAPVRSCSAAGVLSIDANTQSGCNGGTAYVCNDQSPFVSDGQAYAFAAANVNGMATTSMCCACYSLNFTSTAIAGKNLIVQVINTGSDLNSNQFDLQFPGGGFGIFTAGCPKQWPNTPVANWGAQYGGVSQRSECSGLPSPLVAGCQFRFDWFQNANNPSVNFNRVACPAALTSISGCKRNDD